MGKLMALGYNCYFPIYITILSAIQCYQLDE